MSTVTTVSDIEARFLERAVDLARESARSGGGPFGAVVVRGPDVLGEGTNVVTSSHDPTAHAEVVAIRAACRALSDHRLLGCTIFCSCEPCPMCLASIYWSRIGRIVFAAGRTDAARAGFDDELLYREIALPFEQRTISIVQGDDPAAQSPFDVWRASETKVPY